MEPRPHQMVSCPYNKSHQIEHCRLQYHLSVCSKQHPNVRIGHCPFDATHHVKADELNHHVANCPARGIMDTQKYVIDDDHRPPVVVKQSLANFTSSENWDDDNVEAYNPAEAKKGAQIYHKIKGASRSERKRFRFENSIKYAQAQAKDQQGGSGSGQ